MMHELLGSPRLSLRLMALRVLSEEKAVEQLLLSPVGHPALAWALARGAETEWLACAGPLGVGAALRALARHWDEVGPTPAALLAVAAAVDRLGSEVQEALEHLLAHLPSWPLPIEPDRWRAPRCRRLAGEDSAAGLPGGDEPERGHLGQLSFSPSA